MCMSAYMWVNTGKACYGYTIEDNATIGFRNEAFNAMFGGWKAFRDYLITLDRNTCLRLFEEYTRLNHVIKVNS